MPDWTCEEPGTHRATARRRESGSSSRDLALRDRLLVGAGFHQPGSIGFRPTVVVPDPPLVGRGLWVVLGRVLPLLLPTERSHVEVAPGASQRLVAAGVDEVGAEDAVVVVSEEG